MVIIEDFGRLREADTMLLLVLPSLLGIPFEYQHRASNSNLTFALCRTAPNAKRRAVGVIFIRLGGHIP